MVKNVRYINNLRALANVWCNIENIWKEVYTTKFDECVISIPKSVSNSCIHKRYFGLGCLSRTSKNYVVGFSVSPKLFRYMT